MSKFYIKSSEVPGNNTENISNIKPYLTDEELELNEINPTDSNFPYFSDPMNYFIFDIGKYKENKENAKTRDQFIDTQYPNWVNVDIWDTTIYDQADQSGMPVYENGVIPVFTPREGEITTLEPGVIDFNNWGRVFPFNDAGGYYTNVHTVTIRKPEQWSGWLAHYEPKPLTTDPSQTRWTKMHKWYVPYDVFLDNGGPRNNGYIYIKDGVTMNINTADLVTQYYVYPESNTVWKNGSIEFTIKPDKENCTILSGSKNTRIPFIYRSDSNGIIHDANNDGHEDLNTTIIEKINDQFTVMPESAHEMDYIITNGIAYPTAEREFSDMTGTVKYMKLDLIDGKLVFEYHVPNGANKKHVILSTNKNIVDGEWHHIVINRTMGNMQKFPGVQTGGEGAFEIWVDGEMLARTYEITVRDNMPSPQTLFNDISSSAMRAAWLDDMYPEINSQLDNQNYVGGISEFIFRQSYPLSPQEINLNKTYAFLNENDKIIRSEYTTASVKMINPTINTNKKKVLKLYWNNLIKDKTKILNGLELDNDNFDVYTYSVTHKNLLSPSQNLNLDNNYDDSPRFFYENVRAAVIDHVYIYGPQTINEKWSGVTIDKAYEVDTDDNRQLTNVTSLYSNNMLVGGVSLNVGDRILLLGQQVKSENGIWIYNGPTKYLTRPQDVDKNTLENTHVYVEQGNLANTTWVQTNKVKHLRKSKQNWIQVDNDAYVSKIHSYPLHTLPWQDSNGEERFIDVNSDVAEDFDIIVFMNYPTSRNEIMENVQTKNLIETDVRYTDFINNLQYSVSSGKSLYISSPMLAQDFEIVENFETIDQIIGNGIDHQSAAISPFENGEPAENYYNTHRNMKYAVIQELPGLTDKETYIMTDFVTYSPDKKDSEYHIKYGYRQFGLQEGDEFYIPGLTTIPETLNQQLPGYTYNQRGEMSIVGFKASDIQVGTAITKLSNNIYIDNALVANPYDDYITSIAVNYGDGKIFVNCVEDSYAMSRSDYNKAIIQNVTIGENSETVQTAAWQYSTRRLNKKNLYDFSEITNIIGQTDPTNGGGGPIVQAQSHCSNGMIRKNTTKGDLKFQSDLYPDFTEEVFTTTEIPVLSMTWLGLQWLAE